MGRAPIYFSKEETASELAGQVYVLRRVPNKSKVAGFAHGQQLMEESLPPIRKHQASRNVDQKAEKSEWDKAVESLEACGLYASSNSGKPDVGGIECEKLYCNSFHGTSNVVQVDVTYKGIRGSSC
jgi:hypothetical protein